MKRIINYFYLYLSNLMHILRYTIQIHIYKILNMKLKSDKMQQKILHYKEKIKTTRHINRDMHFKIYNKNVIINSYRNILIIGRLREGDSIARFTEAFLLAIDFSCMTVHVFDEATHCLYHFTSATSREFIKKSHPTALQGCNYDLMLFLGVLSHGADNFEDKVPIQKAPLNFAYSVFDGTVLPKGWADAINCYFDGVFVPIDALKTVYENNYVYKPVFTLPILLDLTSYIEYKPSKVASEKYTFGWIGTLGERKNPLKILRSFISEFKDNSNVQLVMHSRYRDNEKDYNEEFFELLKNAPSNVIFTEGILEEERIKDLMKSFDAYIYASKGEGYSNSAREALACGHPLILSSIPAHSCITDLKEEDGIFWVKADNPVDARQTSLNNQYIGKMFDIEEFDLQKSMHELYKTREKYTNSRSVRKRKNAAKFYNKTYLISIFKQVFTPINIETHQENKITENGIFTNSTALVEKYNRLNSKKTLKLICLPARDADFCSLFNQYITHQVYAKDNELIIPDWRLNTVKMYNVHRNGTPNIKYFCYGNENDGNIFFNYFDKPYKQLLSHLEYETDILYLDAEQVIDPDNYNSGTKPDTTYLNSYNMQINPTSFNFLRNKYNAVFNRYISLNSKISKYVNQFYNDNLNGYFTISAFIKCPVDTIELKDSTLQVLDLFEKNIIKILNEVKIDVISNEWRMYIASDNDVALNHFKRKYGNNILSQDKSKLHQETTGTFKQSKELECAQDDINLPHGQEILFDIYMCAKTEYFIFQDSDFSTMISYVNPNLEMVSYK